MIALGDPIRAGTKEAIDSLRERGWEIGLLSGDDERVVRAVARELDLPEALVRGEMTPEAKVDFLRELDARGQCTIMVGDGVNDAAALATAGVGVAVHGAAEASLGAADVHVTTPGLEGIVRLIDGAAATRRVIRRGLRTSLGYNLIAATLAITGLINPIIAAIMMPLSSLSVVSLAQGRSFPRPPRRTDSTRQERA